MKRNLNSNLKILKPYHDTHDSFKKVQQFQFGDKVWIINFGKGDKWIQRVILAKIGPISYKISYERGEAKNIHQLRKKWNEIEFQTYYFQRLYVVRMNHQSLTIYRNHQLQQNLHITSQRAIYQCNLMKSHQPDKM